MATFVVVVDTCSLFPQTLRDTILRAAEAELYRLRWSEEILDELTRNLIEERGITEEQASRLLAHMRSAFPEATVTGYELLTASMTNDPKDRHVLATAVHAGAQVIVTDNLRDFPEEALSPYNIEAQSSDEFLCYLFDMFPNAMARILIDQNAARQRPPELLDRTLHRLAKAAPNFVALLRDHQMIKDAI